MMTGKWPERLVDHKNKIKIDNCWNNLREADHSKNSANRKMHKNNSTGFKGIAKSEGKFIAQIGHNYRIIKLGRFATPEEAHAAYVKKAKELFGEFASAS